MIVKDSMLLALIALIAITLGCLQPAFEQAYHKYGNVESAYTIPKFLDKSPIILVVTGTNSSTFFAEWTAYPQIPFEMGANVQSSETVSFTYIISINQVFYRIRILCEGANQ